MNKCIICDNQLHKYKKKSKFCSLKCNSIFQKKGKDISCEHCEKKFYVSKCNLGRYKYCSKICADICKSKDMIGTRKSIKINIKCGNCEKILTLYPSRFNQNKLGIIYCGHKCKSNAIKKGKAGYGFKKIYENGNPLKHIIKQINGVRKYEHRRIMENYLGRTLEIHEHIHHINGNPQDNHIENLMIVDKSSHGKIEFKENDRLWKN